MIKLCKTRAENGPMGIILLFASTTLFVTLGDIKISKTNKLLREKIVCKILLI